MYLYNIARVATATTGTGTVTLGAAETTFLTFADAGVTDGDVVTYVIENSAGREIGRGTYSSTGPTLSRDAVINSTNANALVNLTGPSTVSITAANVDLPLIASTNDFRLSSVSGNSNPTTEQTAVTTIYLTPHNGNSIGLHDGTGWRVLNTSEVSLSLAGLAANTNFDVFAYINAGAVSLETLAWTNNTTRATALTTQDGVQVRSSNKTRRYIGTIRTTSVVGRTEDSYQNRYVWNCNNMVPKHFNYSYASGLNEYANTTWRSFFGSDLNRVNFVIGVSKESYLSLRTSVLVGSTYNTVCRIALALNSTTAPNNNSFDKYSYAFVTANNYGFANAEWIGYPPNGFGFIQSIQNTVSTASTVTWYGSDTSFKSGITGYLLG